MKLREKTWWKRMVWGLVALLVVLGLVYLWWPSPQAVDVGQVGRGPLVVTVDEDGHTRVRERYTVSATVAGNLERVRREVGEFVEAGGVLATIHPAKAPLLDPRSRAQAEAMVETAQASVSQAQVAVEQAEQADQYARREADRLRGVYRAGGLTQQRAEQAEFEAEQARTRLEAARAAVRVAREQLAQAQAALDAGQDGTASEPETMENMQGQAVGGGPVESAAAVEIRAPVAGTVLQLLQESAAPVQMGTPILELGDPEQLEIVVDVLTTEAVGIKSGAPAQIEQWGGGQHVQAVVRHIEPAAFTRVSSLGVEEQRVNVILDIVEAPEVWRTIGDGFRVEARIVTWEGEDVLKVDASAVFRSPQGWAAYRIVDGRARLTLVEPGARTDREVQILSGLDAGDTVILYPGDTVTDGVRVEARE